MIEHVFPCINIRWVPRAMLKTSGCALGFQHLPWNPANVNAQKNKFDPYNEMSDWVPTVGNYVGILLIQFSVLKTFDVNFELISTVVSHTLQSEELVKKLSDLENSASCDAAVREQIAALPPEVSDISQLAKINGKLREII